MNIKDYLKQIEGEIRQVDDEKEKAESLERLKHIMEVYAGDDEVISSFDLVEEIKQRKEEEKIMSGYKGLDAILNGFRKKRLITISALTKSGKTSFCIDLTSNLREYNPLWIPFEEGGDELVEKFLDRGEEPPLFYLPKSNVVNNLEWVEKKIIEGIAKHNSQIIFIDHLDFLVPFVAERHDLMVGQVMRSLKGLAKKWNVVIFIIAHMKKVGIGTQPSLDDIRGSASIGQESDTVIILWRQSERVNGEVVITNNVNLSVQANRRTGKTGNVKFVFENGHFIEEDWDNIQEVEKQW